MHVHNFFFPDDLMDKLKSMSEETGAPVSELLRRAAKDYIEKRTCQLPPVKFSRKTHKTEMWAPDSTAVLQYGN
jgi:hypothetical protein